MTHYKHFKHLHVPDHWQQYWSKYPNGYTLLEALINWVGQVNDMVDNVNTNNEHVITLDRNFRALDKELRAAWEGYKDKTDSDNQEFKNEVHTIINNFIASIDPRIQDIVADSLTGWLDDGTLADIINEDVFNMKANQSDLDETNSQLAQIAVNVKSFGAVGDGVTDDYEAIQQAFDEAFNTGGALYFPDGMYRITQAIGYSGELTENRSFPTIYGNKATSVHGALPHLRDGSIIFVDGVGVNGINLENKARDIHFYGGVVKDIAIIKRGGIKQTDGSIGLNIRGAIEYRLYNVSILNFDIGFKNEWGWSWDVFGMTTVNNNIGFLLEDNSNAVGMFGVEAHQNNIGGKIVSGANIAINRITLEGQDFGLVITKGTAQLAPSNISIMNPYTEVARKSFISIGKDENNITSEERISGVVIENITYNSDDGINPIQLDNVKGVEINNVTYSNSRPLLSTTDKTQQVVVNPVNNFETNIGDRNSVSNRIGIKNNYNLIPNGLLQFPNLRPYTKNTSWKASFDTVSFGGERVMKMEIPTGTTGNNSTRINVTADKSLTGKRIIFKLTGMVEPGATATFSVFDRNMVVIPGKGTGFRDEMTTSNTDFLCPEGGFILMLTVTNTSGATRNLFIKHLVAIEEGIGEISTSPMDYLVGFSGRVSATPEGASVQLDDLDDEYNVILTPYGNTNTWVEKNADEFTVYSENNVLVDYLIIPQRGLFV